MSEDTSAAASDGITGPKFCAQLGLMSITKLSPNWACQMSPVIALKFCYLDSIRLQLEFNAT